MEGYVEELVWWLPEVTEGHVKEEVVGWLLEETVYLQNNAHRHMRD